MDHDANDHDDSIPAVNELPAILPVFPLTGVLLLPRARLPLHVFEPRYRAMVRDALADGGGVLGMIQPFVPRDDNAGPSSDTPPAGDSSLYGVGCAGFLEQVESLDDGRFLIMVLGIARFRTLRELPLNEGYRRFEVSYDGFALDEHEDDLDVDTERLLAGLGTFSERYGLDLDIERLATLPALALLNTLAIALPFPAAEKQALLEAGDVASRVDTLLSLMRMGLEPGARLVNDEQSFTAN
ncbi:MAG: LON peptidase substrate-binding domain-containing protein [Acidobacteriota bacterium]